MDNAKNGEASKGVRRNSSSPPPAEEVLNCPRCDSPNTKFCYYNNYSRTQPRHYCKACRRYWTRGGALRNVPVGGGCRKNRKSKSSCSSYACSTSSSASRLGLDNILYSSEITSNRFKFFHGFSSEFNRCPYTTCSTGAVGSWSSYGGQCKNTLSSLGIGESTASAGSSLLDINYLIGNFSDQTSLKNTHSSSKITSTIECLSSINQDMHCKLQKQRLGMFYEGGYHHDQHHSKKETNIVVSDLPSTSYDIHHQDQNQNLPISFHDPITSESLGFASGTSPTIPNSHAFDGDDSGINTSSGYWYQKFNF